MKKTEVEEVKPETCILVRERKVVSFLTVSVATSVFLVSCILSAALVAFPVSSRADTDWSLSVDINKKPSNLEPSPIDRGSAYSIWAEVISDSYGVSVGFVNALYERRYDFGNIALMLEIAHAAERDPSDVAVLRRKGLGWGAIAKELGVHPASLKRAKGKESLFRRYVLSNCLAGYYGISDATVLYTLEEKGYGFDEIAIAVNLCARSEAPLGEVIVARGKGAKWKAVAEKFKVSPAKLGAPPSELVSSKAKEKGSGKGEEKPAKGKESPAKGKKDSGKKSSEANCSTLCPKKCY